ncbi:MAG: class I SAM-dependent methyltransferase family protein [Candidatus Diapherotrites archaeon CG10_big_fil_rev_8_21_14_0_10_31_34]|nr:MAG: class I SAM-dependent methyltransferase family protein [Candidatus Diapherotrites archaeon CG10_big_fil_rev_8_21_14_0_10_31_34]
MQQGNLKEVLKSKLTKKELAVFTKSFDSLGNIVVIEIPKELEKKEKLIGNTIIQLNKNIKTVCKIAGPHKGKYRLQKLKIIAGEKNFIAEYKESNSKFVFDVRKTFFSPRLGTERLRISKLIKKDEMVGCFFAGVGPYPIVFARNSEMKKAVAVELNPEAIKFMKKNIELNKCTEKITVIKDDVNKLGLKLKNSFDRIVMPMPHGGETFLSATLKTLKKGGVIHFYQVLEKETAFDTAIERAKKECIKQKRNFVLLDKRKVRPFSATKMQVVIDFKAE